MITPGRSWNANGFARIAIVLVTLFAASRAPAQVLVWSMGNSIEGTQSVANWLEQSGQFSSVTAVNSSTLTILDLQSYQQVLFFSNSSGDPSVGNVLAEFAASGRRLVVATFSWANQGANTLGGSFVSEIISPVAVATSSLYTTATLGTTDQSALFTGVTEITGYYRDAVVATPGSTIHAYWSDGQPFVVSKGNVVAITLFPDDTAGAVSGDYRTLFVNALSIQAIPEPSTYALLALGIGMVVWWYRRR